MPYQATVHNVFIASPSDVRPEREIARQVGCRDLRTLADKHYKMLGRYHFTVTDSILRGDLGPLRDPNTPEELFWAAGP